MARALLQSVFAAILAFWSSHAVLAVPRLPAQVQAVWRAEADQCEQCDSSRPVPVHRRPQPAPRYIPPALSEPDLAVLFERPPPALSLLAVC
jgi:hypothetical protein